jgi:hypothetical protein
MNKNTMICFRTSRRLRDALKEIAEDQRRSLSALVENIVSDYVTEQDKSLEGKEKDRRKHFRKKTSIPVILRNPDMRETPVHTGTIRDISLGGVRIVLPKNRDSSWITGSREHELHLVFVLPEGRFPMNFKCRPSRINGKMDGVQVGAVFSDAEFESYQALQRYLN